MTLPTIFRRSLIAIAMGVTVSGTAAAQEREMLNSSYDIARCLLYTSPSPRD